MCASSLWPSLDLFIIILALSFWPLGRMVLAHTFEARFGQVTFLANEM